MSTKTKKFVEWLGFNIAIYGIFVACFLASSSGNGWLMLLAVLGYFAVAILGWVFLGATITEFIPKRIFALILFLVFIALTFLFGSMSSPEFIEGPKLFAFSACLTCALNATAIIRTILVFKE